MKKILFFLAIVFQCTVFAQSNVTLRFTGKNFNNNYVQLDSVIINNISQSWTETIYYPDTIINMSNTVGISESEVSSFEISNLRPNPFDGVANFNLSMPSPGDVYLQIIDAKGTVIANLNEKLNSGVYAYELRLKLPGTYFINAKNSSNLSTAKLVNVGNAGKNTIIQTGNIAAVETILQAKLTSTNPFQLGDEFSYTGYVTVDGQNYTSEVIIKEQNDSEDFELLFDICETISNEFTEITCDTYTWNEQEYTESGDFIQNFQTNHGCDSIVTLHLTINNSNTGIDVQEHCESYTWIDGVTYTASTNTPTFTLANLAGCDSVVTLHLTINNSNTGIDVQEHCDSYTWIDGVTYTTSTTTPTFTLTNVAGCDSVVTLHLTINNSNTGIDVQEHCDSYTWIDGVTYTTSTTTPTFTLTNFAGCDSVVTLHLTINNNFGIDIQEHCESYTWIDGVTYTASTNTPTWTLTKHCRMR